MNLLHETEDDLELAGYTFADIRAIQSGDIRISVEKFKELADVEYDSGYGSQKVAMDLNIIMNDGTWFSRGEYDGSEWWAHHRAPAVIDETQDDKVKSLVCSVAQIGWCSLSRINNL